MHISPKIIIVAEKYIKKLLRVQITTSHLSMLIFIGALGCEMQSGYEYRGKTITPHLLYQTFNKYI